MKNTTTAVIYIAFFTLIGFSVWVTKSPGPLWALLLTNMVPSIISGLLEDDKKKEVREEEKVSE
jgi:hypothetical protein